jgi:anti-anti-sigma factor
MLIEEAAKFPALPFIIDFSNVWFLSSLSLAALVRVAKEFENRAQRLTVASLQSNVKEVIEVTRLTRFLEVHENLPAACDAIRRRLPPRLSRDEDEVNSGN